MNDTTTNYIKECSIAGYAYTIIVEFPSNKYVLNQVITSAACCILTIPVILLNGITVYTLLKHDKLKEKVCHFLVLIQSIADLSVGLLTLPLFAFLHLSEVYGTPECVLSFVLSTIAFIPWGLSLAALCMLTLERYMGVLHPIIHRNYLTRRTCLRYTYCVLLVTCIIVPLAVASAIFYYIFCVVYAMVPLLLHTFCYVRIFSASKKILRGNAVDNIDNETESSSSSRIVTQHTLKELKLAKSCALVVATFYVCCIPGEFLNLYYLSDTIAYRVVISWYAAALGVNTILNSVIYFWTRPILRNEAIKVLKSICCDSNISRTR